MMKGSDILVKTLQQHHVKYLFGLPGDTSLEWYESLRTCSDTITHVLATDERHAAFMADAYARVTNTPGVCEGPSGGGATYMLPGILEANDSSIPLLAINTDIPTHRRKKAVLTEIDQVRLFEPVTKWSVSVDEWASIHPVMKKAFEIATTDRPGAVHVTFPMDVLRSETPSFPDESPVSTHIPRIRPCPPLKNSKKALDLILQSEMPVIIAGGGIHLSKAYTALEQFATTLGCLVGTSITGKGSMDERHPLCLGVVGTNGGNTRANALVLKSDLIIFAGTQCGSVVTAHQTLPPDDGKRKIITMSIDSTDIRRNYTVDCELLGDARVIFETLIQLLDKKPYKRETRLETTMHQWKEKAFADITRSSDGIHPLDIVRICRNHLPPHTIFTVDAGTPTPYFASFYPLGPGRTFVIPRAHGGLGYAVPAVVGAHLGDPSSQIVALTGDGSMLMSMAELSTIIREEIPAVIILFHNNEYSWIKSSLHYLQEEHYLSLDFPDLPYGNIAQSMGFSSFTVETKDEFEESLHDALTHEEPAFIDARTASLPTISDGTLPRMTT
jgi:acetolactate synthase-1/2/3 large subunit